MRAAQNAEREELEQLVRNQSGRHMGDTTLNQVAVQAGHHAKLLETNGAKGGTRTPTGVTPPDPKSDASAKFRHFRSLCSIRFPF